MLTDKKISVVVVCYRDAGAFMNCTARKELRKDYPHYEIIYVNDASRQSEEILLPRKRSHPDRGYPCAQLWAQVAFTSIVAIGRGCDRDHGRRYAGSPGIDL
jgi:cellulose synthase/poly-beta-1,6-N-acetylglucosamine synthase-like glycosyltransferase